MSESASEDNHTSLLRKFRQITGVDEMTAVHALSASSWNFEVALESYYNRIDEETVWDEPAQDFDHAPSTMTFNQPIEDDVIDNKPSLGDRSSRKKAEKPRFGTLAGLKAAENTDSSEDEGGQAYYAGGSQHSGQQVLGPPSRKKKDIVSEILKSAQRVGVEVSDFTRPSTSNKDSAIFAGTGYRLGQTEDDTEVLPSASLPSIETATVILRLWRDGFSIDDGPLRSYDDPSNKDFLDSIREGLIPDELTQGHANQILHLDLVDRHEERYIPPVAPRRIKAFSGAGHVLGSPAPPVLGTPDKSTISEENQGQQIVLDSNQPTVNIIIRLANGFRLNGQFNPSHTIRDVRSFIAFNRPEYIDQAYTLRTTLPAISLTDDQTLKELGLNNSVITMIPR